MIRIVLLILALFSSLAVVAQDGDRVLFHVEDNAVRVSEFEYIYNKNNGKNADYSRASIEEYLDLYIKFKLKVQKAKDMRLDTIQALNEELAGYRKQLANSYLVDKEVTHRLVDEAYERMQTEVRISHILIGLRDRATDDDIRKAEDRALAAKAAIKAGKSFEDVALEYSDDGASAANGGDLGFLSAMLPQGFYALENAIYTTPVGSVSDVVRSRLGFHLVRVTDRRPARGEMEVAHILVRKKKKGHIVTNARARIDSIHALIQRGADFESIAKSLSEDQNTKAKGGHLGFFGINQFEQPFEDAAFALTEDGAVSAPIQTSIGWHIIKRLGRRDYSDRTRLTHQLQTRVTKDDRFAIARSALIERIKREGGFRENSVLLDQFSASLDDQFYTYTWKVGDRSPAELFSFDGQPAYSLLDFANFCKKNTRKRLRFDKKKPLKDAVSLLYADFVDEKTVAFEESRLEEKYPEFKSLMREYEEGILLFEATKMEVWDRASQDTSGLRKYFKQNRGLYVWHERANLHHITIQGQDAKLAKKIRKSLKKKGLQKTLDKFNKDVQVVSYREHVVEHGSRELRGLNWKVGAMTDAEVDAARNTTHFNWIAAIMPSTQKTLNEARGYVIADYQDHLEKKWVASLKRAYRVDVDQSVVDGLIRG